MRAKLNVGAGFMLSIAAGLCIPVAGRPAMATDSWEVLLRHQLRSQQRCVLDEILFVREVPVGKIVGLEGRVRCSDTREFDFKRDHANEKFTIRLCEPVVC
jgi:hypothetical protein